MKWIVFDCDGTLVDSRDMIKLTWQGYHRLYPNRKKLPYEYFIPCFSKTDEQIADYLQIDEEYRGIFFEQYCLNKEPIEKFFRPFEDVNALLIQLHNEGYHLAVNTSRISETFQMAKDQLKACFDLFEFAVTSDQITHKKPHEESLLLCQKKCGCEKEDILYVGDSKSDAECARRAKIPFVLATWGAAGIDQMNDTVQVKTTQELYDYIKNRR